MPNFVDVLAPGTGGGGGGASAVTLVEDPPVSSGYLPNILTVVGATSNTSGTIDLSSYGTGKLAVLEVRLDVSGSGGATLTVAPDVSFNGLQSRALAGVDNRRQMLVPMDDTVNEIEWQLAKDFGTSPTMTVVMQLVALIG